MKNDKKRGPKPTTPIITTELCAYGCGSIAQYLAFSGKLQCSLSSNSCIAQRHKFSNGLVKAHAEGKMEGALPKWARDKGAAKNGELQRSTTRWMLYDAPWDDVSGNQRRPRLLIEQKGKCALCDISQTWNNKPLVFQYDHIDGNNKNNQRKNVRMLCPNCHTQTENWGYKKRISE